MPALILPELPAVIYTAPRYGSVWGTWWFLLAWTAFFAAVGFLNLYVAYNFSVEFWGTFKVFGLFGISLVFIIAQSLWVVSKLGDDAVQVKDGD